MRKSTDMARIAAWNSIIFGQGVYTGPDGLWVRIKDELHGAMHATVVIHSDWLQQMLDAPQSRRADTTDIQVLDKTAIQALLDSPPDDGFAVGILNFASARRPGGGYLNGARAQEEDLCRCSGLYPCLERAAEFGFYALAAGKDGYYTDHMVLSRQVPVFREDQSYSLVRPRYATFITAAAPNIGSLNTKPNNPRVVEVLTDRIGKVLALAQRYHVKTLILGAWGCGVFGNDPRVVAGIFWWWLGQPRFAGAFDSVIFAVPSFGKAVDPNLEAFRAAFEQDDE